MKDRQAIEQHNREKRISSAQTASELRLAEVEQAIIASKQALDKEAAEMSEQVKADRITQSVAQERMSARRAQHLKLIDKMKDDIVDPIAKDVEGMAKVAAPSLPERTPVQIEASTHYASLDSDARQDAITRAITGKDDVLAAALLTGRDPITDVTREQLMRRFSDGDMQDKIMKLAKRVQSTLTTIYGAKK